MPIREVTLRVLGDNRDAMRKLAEVNAAEKALENPKIEVKVDDKKALFDLDKLALKLRQLNFRAVDLGSHLKGDALDKLDKIQRVLLKLNSRDWNIPLGVDGYLKTRAELAAIEAQLARLAGGVNIPFKDRFAGGFFGGFRDRYRGVRYPGAPGELGSGPFLRAVEAQIAKDMAGGGSGGGGGFWRGLAMRFGAGGGDRGNFWKAIFSAFGGGGGAIAGAAGAASAAGGGGGGGPLSWLRMAGLTAAGSIGVGLIPSLLPFLLGGGITAFAAKYAMSQASAGQTAIQGAQASVLSAKQAVQQAQLALKQATTPAQRQAARLQLQQAQQNYGIARGQLSGYQKQYGPYLPLNNVFSGVQASMLKAFTPFAQGLVPILQMVGKTLISLQPQFTAFFKSLLPFANIFAKIFGQAAKVLIPALTATFKSLKPVLPEIAKGVGLLVQAFAYFLKDLGPGMKDSAAIFVGVATIIKGLMIGLAAVINFVAKFIHGMGTIIVTTFRWIGIAGRDLWGALKWAFNEIVSLWKNVWTVVKTVASVEVPVALGFVKNLWHDITSIFHTISSTVSSIWSSMWNTIKSTVSSAVGWISGAISHLLSMVPGSGLVGGLLGHLGIHLASAPVGIGGHSPFTPVGAPRIGPPSPTAGPLYAGGSPVVINFNGVVTDPDGTARAIHSLLRQYKTHRGGMALGLA